MLTNDQKSMDKIVNLCKSRGFVYPGSEIYGGLANSWDYGPLGVELKNNIKRAWWQKFVQESPYNVGLDASIIMNPETWVASGHLGGFSYPLMDWGRAKNQVRREQVRLKQRELNLDNTKRTIEQEIREIVRSVYEAEKRYRINRRNQEVAVQSYRISQMRFENGDMTSQELSIEQERLSQVQLAYIDSYITYRLSVADLNRKTMYDFEHNRSFMPEDKELAGK